MDFKLFVYKGMLNSSIFKIIYNFKYVIFFYQIKHISKTYNVTIDIPVTNEMVEGFKQGVSLNDGECQSAILEKTGAQSTEPD